MAEKTPVKIERTSEERIIHYGIIGAIIVLALIIVFGSVYTISAGERGVLLTFGKPDQVAMSEGLHFKIPIMQSVVKMNVQTQKYTVEKTSAASSDLQTVTTDVAINYYISPESAPMIYQTIGVDYQDKVIAPAVQEVVKASTAQYTAEELITKRAEVKDKIDMALRDRLKQFNILVQTISITNFDFSPQFNAAIESKVTAQQNALTEENNLKAIQFKAQQRVAQAEGEATAIKIQAQAIQSQGGAAYVQLQAIGKWNGQLPLVSGAGSTPFIDMRSLTPTVAVATNITN